MLLILVYKVVLYFESELIPYSFDHCCFFVNQYPPPLVPPRGEVNAADAFDIGSFDEDDVKGIKVRRMQDDVLTQQCLLCLREMMKQYIYF